MNNIINPNKVTIAVYVNGVIISPPNTGGWGIYAKSSDNTALQFSGYHPDSTSNRMELTAAVYAIKKLASNNHLNIISNSKYLIDGMNLWMDNWVKNGWKNSQ